MTDAAPRHHSGVYLRFLQAVYDFFYVLTVLVCLPVIAVLMLTRRRWRHGLRQRLGFGAARAGTRPAIWIHGVSAGEVMATRELVKLIDAELPWVDVVISTTTVTGWAAAHRIYPEKLIVFYPLDFSFSTRAVMRRVRPSLVVLMELELWPNFLLTTSLRRVPVLLANGRMSAKSARDYRILQRLIPEPMTRVIHYCVQSEQYAERFRSLGVPPESLTITGSMKFDTVARGLPASVREDYERRLGVTDGVFVLLGGSTHPGEDEMLLEALARIRERDPAARLVLVPRHPERIRDIDAAVRAQGLRPVHLSALPPEGPGDADTTDLVVIGDTVGELARLYVVADLVFVGGSLTRRGGQNMMEPAGLGKPVVVGPNTWNFRDPMELLLSREGIRQAPGREEVLQALVDLHADPEGRSRLGENARKLCLESKGATRRILDILGAYVPAPADGSARPPPVAADC